MSPPEVDVRGILLSNKVINRWNAAQPRYDAPFIGRGAFCVKALRGSIASYVGLFNLKTVSRVTHDVDNLCIIYLFIYLGLPVQRRLAEEAYIFCCCTLFIYLFI